MYRTIIFFLMVVFQLNYINIKCDTPTKYLYSRKFTSELVPGTIITITAKATDKAERFALRFGESATGRDLFQFNPRFPGKRIIRNSMDTNLAWLEEETTGPFPFVMDKTFKLSIGIYPNEFRYAVDGKDVGTFKFRDTNLLKKLDEFNIFTEYGLNLLITDVDIKYTGTTNYENFALYSKLDENLVKNVDYIIIDETVAPTNSKLIIL